MGEILWGKEVARKIKEELKKQVDELKQQGKVPKLATILVGDDPASLVYINQKHKACKEINIESENFHLPKDTPQDRLISLIKKLNHNEDIDGILIQLPLPGHLDTSYILSFLSAEKDVDGFHPFNTGLFFQEKAFSDILKKDLILPCTPLGIIKLLEYYNIPISGKDVVIVGRSNIVGKPLYLLFLANDATVTLCHTKTRDLKQKTLSADILVAAVGKPKLITSDIIKEGAVVIDVGVNRVGDKLVGDVDFDKVVEKASYITPVPGGVGPMTVTMLLYNTILIAKKRCKKFS